MPGDRRATDPAIEMLTPRERECLRLVNDHLSSKQIGRRLGISKHTVDTHVDKARQHSSESHCRSDGDQEDQPKPGERA